MNFRKGLVQAKDVDYSHLIGRLDGESLLNGLGIEMSHRIESQIICHCPNLTGNHSNGDANPSFGFNEEKLLYNCFVCGGGNLLDMIVMMNGGNNEEALRFAELHSSLEPPAANELLAKVQNILSPQQSVTVMTDYNPDILFPFKKIHPYLYDRGLTKEIIVEMQVGFDDEHCGIVIPHMFQGKLRGWQTRHLAQDEYGKFLCDYCETHDKETSEYSNKKVAKYKNTKHFPKDNTLYGYDQMKQTLKRTQQDWVIVVESPMTALYLMSHGYRNVVATFGQFSMSQAMLLLAIPNVLFWPDNDDAGYENAQRAIKALGHLTVLKIVPVVEGDKNDAANLLPEEIGSYLESAYISSLFPIHKLATLAQLTGV